MKQDPVRSTAFLVLLSGLALLLTYFALLIGAGGNPKPFTYPNEKGFTSAIVWFEFARTPEEVFQVLGEFESDQGKEIRSVMNRMNKWDFPFMTSYSLYHACAFLFTFALARAGGRKFFNTSRYLYLGFLLSFIMLVGDIVETVQLLRLTEFPNEQSIPQFSLDLLFYFSRAKWVALGLASVLFGVNLAGHFGKRLALILPIVLTSGGIMILMGVFVFEALAELAVPFMALGWIGLLVYSYIYIRPKKVQSSESA